MAAATVVVKEINGASGSKTYTTCSSTATSWFRVSDAHGNSSPSEKIPIPASGMSYSYWKSYCAEVTANASNNTLDNWKFYFTANADWQAGGKFGTNGGLKAGYSGSTYGFDISTYEQATGENNADGNWNGSIMTDHTQITTANNMPTSATAYDSRTITSTGSTNYFVLQTYVDTDATLGTVGAATAHIQYDES